jgi:5-methylcytosine-specific restriction endonuclease McrA
MKLCPKCDKQHDKLGIYCCRSCANSRTWSDADKELKSTSAEKYTATLDNTAKRAMTASAILAVKEKAKNALANNDFVALSASHKRKRILTEQDYLCNLCPQTLIWNGKPLSFQLDHISGDRKDESRANLQMICPNCHSQTDTYGGKNGRKITNKQIEDVLETSENNHHVCAKLGLNPSAHTYNRINKIRNKSGSLSSMVE